MKSQGSFTRKSTCRRHILADDRQFTNKECLGKVESVKFALSRFVSRADIKLHITQLTQRPPTHSHTRTPWTLQGTSVVSRFSFCRNVYTIRTYICALEYVFPWLWPTELQVKNPKGYASNAPNWGQQPQVNVLQFRIFAFVMLFSGVSAARLCVRMFN